MAGYALVGTILSLAIIRFIIFCIMDSKGGEELFEFTEDEENKKDVDDSQYTSVKASGDYPILTVKDLPIDKSNRNG